MQIRSAGRAANIAFKLALILATAFTTAATLAPPATAGGRIVVANDEWTLSRRGAQPPSQPQVFVLNVADWFTHGRPGRFLGYSDNLGIQRTQLVDIFATGGHQFKVSTRVNFTLETLLRYDGIFLGGYPADNEVLIDYVNSGGNVYLFAGTGSTGRFGRAVDEAERWNDFLGEFGLALAAEYNRLSGHMLLAESHDILAGVNSLFQNNGQSVIDLAPNDPRNRVIAFHADQGLYAIYDPLPSASPPSSMDVGAK